MPLPETRSSNPVSPVQPPASRAHWATPELEVLSLPNETLVSGNPNFGSDGILYS